MGRAPTSGAPPRVSAHVVPKAPPFSTDDEEEKTSIESGGWEEESSTTVEQGDVAEKVRALGLGLDAHRRANSVSAAIATPETSPGEEPTIDGHRGILIATLPPTKHAGLLVVTNGKDAGQTLEVRPGKTYTVGRGIDNDLVLSDLSVSRKHFDLRFDNGSWLVSDRGSGNGTLINSRLEDAPFTLSSGDVIEIGTTGFRFELPGATLGREESLEPAAATGDPLAEPAIALPASAQLTALTSRPGPTQPPPAPRARASTVRPPSGPERSGMAQLAPSGAPLAPSLLASPPAMASPPPMQLPPPPVLQATPPVPSAVPALALPGRTPGMHDAQLGPHGINGPGSGPIGPLSGSLNLPLSTQLGAALGGHGNGQGSSPISAQLGHPPHNTALGVVPSPPRIPSTLPGQGMPQLPRGRVPYPYGDERVGQSPMRTSRGMMAMLGQPPRDATSTALVPPITYSGQRAIAIPPRAQRPRPLLTPQMRSVAIAVGVVAVAASITLAIIKSSDTELPPVRGAGKSASSAAPKPAPVKPPAAAPSQPAASAPSPASSAPAAATQTAAAPATPPVIRTESPASSEYPKVAVATPPPIPPARITLPTDGVSDQADDDPDTAPSRAIPPARITEPAEPTEPAPPPPPARSAPTRSAPVTRTPPRRVPERVEKRAKPEPEAPAPKKRGRVMQEAKSEADALYRKKDFAGAATVVANAAATLSGADAADLKSIAAVYKQLGQLFNVGMAPGTKATDAFGALNRAVTYDRDLGGAFTAEIQKRLVSVAARAASSFMASKEYDSAFRAVKTAEDLGSTSPTNKAVRDSLEAAANDLYRAASRDAANDITEAKRKLRQIQGMVDSKTAVYAKATKLLNSLSQ